MAHASKRSVTASRTHDRSGASLQLGDLASGDGESLGDGQQIDRPPAGRAWGERVPRPGRQSLGAVWGRNMNEGCRRVGVGECHGFTVIR